MSGEHIKRVGYSHGPCIGFGGYLGLFWDLAGIVCARGVIYIPLASPVYGLPPFMVRVGAPKYFSYIIM